MNSQTKAFADAMSKAIQHSIIHMGMLQAPDAPGPDMPDLPRRTQADPVLGYRSWQIDKHEGEWRIFSPQQRTRWDGPILRADHPPDDRSPWSRGSMFGAATGHHGIYAWRLIDGPMRIDRGTRVEGIVELLGKVVAHEKGYRAEMVRIRRLWIFDLAPEWVPEAVRDLLATYACDVAVGEDPAWSKMRSPEAVDPDECPICNRSHPATPLACETDEGGGLVVLGTEEEAEEAEDWSWPAYPPPSSPSVYLTQAIRHQTSPCTLTTTP